MIYEISIVEMHCFDIFAAFAYQMVLDPRLWRRKNRGACYWATAYNLYPRAIRKLWENGFACHEFPVNSVSPRLNR